MRSFQTIDIDANPLPVLSKQDLKRLRYLDLLNLAQVSTQFETQAKAAFASKYEMLRLLQSDCDQNKMENILRVFGSLIQSLRIGSNKNAAGDPLFLAIIQNCSPKLKRLNLFGFNIQVDSLNSRLPFPKLKELGLGQCSGNLDLARLIDNCSVLETISLEDCNFQSVNGMISRKFKRLESLHIMQYDGEISKDALENFIMSNPALKELWIDARYGSSHAIRLIGQNMLELQEMHLHLSIYDLQYFQSDVEYIGQLRSLEKLGLHFNGLEVASLANTLATNNLPIENLFMSHGSIDDTAIKYILQLKQINTIEIHRIDGLNKEHLIDLAKNLPELQEMNLTKLNVELTLMGLLQVVHHAKKLRELHLVLKYGATGFTINTDDYKAMVAIVKNRPEKNCL